LIHRRDFFKMAGLSFGAAAAGLSLPGFGAQAAPKKTHLTTDQALESLREGNKKLVAEGPAMTATGRERRLEIARGMKAQEYIQYDAMGLGELVNKGEVTADELLDTALEIARKVEPKVGSLCHVEEETARRRIKAGLPKGPFTGVPFVLKDIKAAAEDIPMSLGSKFFANTKTPFDGEIVKRYREGGLVIFGRSTTSELALYIGTEADAYGYDTANPWNLEYSPGGLQRRSFRLHSRRYYAHGPWSRIYPPACRKLRPLWAEAYSSVAAYRAGYR
jgi:hypothetical protein